MKEKAGLPYDSATESVRVTSQLEANYGSLGLDKAGSALASLLAAPRHTYDSRMTVRYRFCREGLSQAGKPRTIPLPKKAPNRIAFRPPKVDKSIALPSMR